VRSGHRRPRRRVRHTEAVKAVRRKALFEGAAVVGVLVAAMWLIEIVNKLDGQRLSQDGIYPRSLAGLPGILSAPFLHVGFSHLIGNTIPFIVLGLVIAVAGARRIVEVTVIVILVGGLGTWLTAASHSDTVGASGVVFGYAGFLIARGIFTRAVGALLIGVLVAVLFGVSLAADLVPRAGVSWQGHLFGGLAGILAARLLTGGGLAKAAVSVVRR
jgi:membrane associated rhomboid family serine protease